MKSMYIWFLTILFMLSGLKVFSQDNNFFGKLHSLVLQENSNFRDKLLFFSSDLPAAEEDLNAWKKTQFTFVQARLKGGSKGFQVVILFEKGNTEQEISVKKKSESSGFLLLGVEKELYNKLKSIKNLLMDSSSEPIQSGIKENELFNLIAKQITR